MGSILITNESLAAAMHELLAQLHIPAPKLSRRWRRHYERLWLEGRGIPAYLASLEKLGEVQPAAGFSIKLAATEFFAGQVRRIEEAEHERAEHE